MKKNFVGQKPIIFRRSNIRERIGEIINITEKYFTSFHSHDMFGIYTDEPYILENALYTCSGGVLNPNIVGSINLSYPGLIPCVFYEDKHKYDNGIYATNVITINVNEKFAGYYLPEINTLALTDWTHDIDCVVVFRKLWPQLVDKLQLTQIDLSTQTRTVSDITVGCDPEFEIIDRYSNEITTADDIIEHDCYSQIGTDGSGDQIEIRPKPGNPVKVTQNIRKLVKKFKDSLGDRYDLTDEGNYYPLGGHIHVGVGFEMTPDHNLLMLLNDFIGKPTIKLSGDARNEYKKMGAYRSQPHGFEYRTPPASVFQNPAISCIVMKLAGNLSKKYLNGTVFEYDSENLTVQDYIEIGGLTKNQARYYMKFCDGGYKPTQSIMTSWRVGNLLPLKRTNTPTVVFQHTWEPYVKEILVDRISKIKTVQPVTIKLYGLSAKTYGKNKTTIPINCCALANNNVVAWNPEKRILSIGVTYDRRTYLCSLTSDFIKGMTRAINDKLNELEA